MKRFTRERTWRRRLIVLCILVCAGGCQSALYNTYPVPGEEAGQGLKYYRTAFPRGQRPDPWQGQSTEAAEPEQGNDAEETATTEESTNP